MRAISLPSALLLAVCSTPASAAIEKEWTKVGPAGTFVWLDLESRDWVAFGPQALVAKRTILLKPDALGTRRVDEVLLVNCARNTIAVLDRRGFTSGGTETFMRSEDGLPRKVGAGQLEKQIFRSACSPPAIQREQ